MPIQPGQTLSHYRLIEQIGEGGMGVVWKALDTQLQRHVALKLLPTAVIADPGRRQRFRREAQAAAALDHPNIAVIHEVGEHQGQPFIVMQYLEGTTLGDMVRQRPLPVSEWLRIARSIADGLAHAHKQGIVHRDLKPDNVMITGEGQVKLLDFGLAKLIEVEPEPLPQDAPADTRLETISRELTRSGSVVGTVAYMSPEQARGEQVDHRSDLFSFGVMLYEMASGKRPFSGRSSVESLHATIADEPPPLSQVTGDVPAEAERVVRKALEKEPGRRYQDAADLATDLRNLKRDLDSGRASVTSGVTTAVAPRRRSPWVLGSALAGVALVVVAAAYLYLGRQPAAPEATATPAGGSSIAVVGFENLSDPADADHLGRMLMGLITTDLAESGGLSVISMPKVLAALRQVSGGGTGGFDASIASEAAQLAGAQVMMVGQVGRAGDQLILTAELIDVASGRTLGSTKQEASSASELFSVAGAIAGAARRVLGNGGAADFDLARALTASPEAYRHYAAGEVALHQFRWSLAAESFDRAIREDPTFALAYLRGSIARSWGVGDAVALLQEGLPHVDRLPRRWRAVYQAYLDYARHDYDAAYDAMMELVDASTDIPDAYYLVGEISIHVGRYLDFLKVRQLMQRALDIDPTFRVVLFHLVDAYLIGGHVAEARQLVMRLQKDDPDDPAVMEMETAVLAVEGKLDEAIAKAEALYERDPEQIYSRLGHYHLMNGHCERARQLVPNPANEFQYSQRGFASICAGRLSEGLEDLRVAGEKTAGGLTAPLGAHFLVNRALLIEALGDTDGALEAAREAVRLAPDSPGPYFFLGRLQLESGKTDAAERTLEDLRGCIRQSVAKGWGRFWEHMLETELHLAASDLPAAEQAFAHAWSLAPEHRALNAELITRARLRARGGDRSAAIDAYREVLSPRVHLMWGTVVENNLIRYELARLEEEAGDVAAARDHYREFLGYWGETDLLVPAAEEARARLAALER